MKKIFLIFLFTYTAVSYSQNEIQIETNLGFLYQGEIEINNEQLDNTGAFGARLGVNYLKKFTENFYLETGLFLKYNTGSFELETVVINYATIRLQVPLYAGYTVNDLWRFNIGASVENNKDFEDLAFVFEENLRYDLITKAVYTHSDLLDFSLYANFMLSRTLAVNNITNPRNGIYLGVIFKLPKRNKTKES